LNSKHIRAIRVFLFLSFLILAGRGAAQHTPQGFTPLRAADYTTLRLTAQDSLPLTAWQKKWRMDHSPLKATLMAAALPGAGQIYNKKYWKLPILYAGMGTCVGFIVHNTREYRVLRDSFIAANDGDPNTIPELDPQRYNLDVEQDRFRRYTELSYMALLGVYILQIIDANVDAHLFYFDVSPDLSLEFHPTLLNTGRVHPGLGISLRL
jgi:hypothetical protein